MKIRIGTRGSPLALKQTHLVASAIRAHFPGYGDQIEVITILTTGDRLTDRSLVELGGKSLFTKEIEQALLEGSIDLAVHSMKDMPAEPPEGLITPAMLEREDPRDALITRDNIPLCDLPEGALLGTSSLRRQAQMLRLCPHLKVVPLRGNVGTRLEKIRSGQVDATLLAVAGLKRLEMFQGVGEALDAEVFTPAVGQGAIGIQCRENDAPMKEMLGAFNHEATFLCVTVERAFMRALDGSCRLPLGGYATLEGDQVTFRGFVSDPEGQDMREHRTIFPKDEAVARAFDLGLQMKS